MKADIDAYIYALQNIDLEALDAVAQRLCNTLNNKGRIFVAGNGGSHAVAQHFACDLMKSVGAKYLDCQVTCLSDNTAMMTAIANDIGYGQAFSKQVENIELGIHDTVVCFSVSGSSPNIRELQQMANTRGGNVYLISGRGIGQDISNPRRRALAISTRYESSHHMHYYASEVAFSVMAHEIVRLFHIRRGNYIG